MRHYTPLLVATLAIGLLSAGCESWSTDNTDRDMNSSDQTTESMDQSAPNKANAPDQTSDHDSNHPRSTGANSPGTSSND